MAGPEDMPLDDALEALSGAGLLALRYDAMGAALEIDLLPDAAASGNAQGAWRLRLTGVTALHVSGENRGGARPVIYGAAVFEKGGKPKGWRAEALEDAMDLLGCDAPGAAFAGGARLFVLDPEDGAPLVAVQFAGLSLTAEGA
ncbi:hypothetical protein ACQ5SO_00765 [Rhodovulum sp. DZ06]|uniref:hypothetical protein n=1 Tax=Rhodovulum sp. DZ06 TaxID=3425126 RepID=UPI003D32FBE9